MKKSGLQLTLVAVLVVVVSIALAAGLSALTLPDTGAIAPGGETIAPPTPEENPDQSAGPGPSPNGGLPGGNEEAVLAGRLPGFEGNDINTDPDTFCYLINSDVALEKPDGPGNIMVENDPGNLCPMQLCYYLEETEELIYTSAMIYPGQHVASDTLSVKLKKGTYQVNAVISVYDDVTMDLKTTFHETVTLTVNQKFLGLF